MHQYLLYNLNNLISHSHSPKSGHGQKTTAYPTSCNVISWCPYAKPTTLPGLCCRMGEFVVIKLVFIHGDN